jgi:hypothetical protein
MMGSFHSGEAKPRALKAALCALLLCCSGCLGHKVAIDHGFHLRENSGNPMLVPPNDQGSNVSNFQTATLVLPGGSASAKAHVGSQCTINGEIFSFRSESSLDSKHWIVRSPSISGWNTLAGKTNIDLQWKSFMRSLAHMHEEGCFPAGLTALEIRVAIAQRIPLPANEVPLFFYSDQGVGFTDLAPGMEVRLQRFLPSGKSINAQSIGAPRTWIANYEVLPGHGEGVRLKLARKGPNRDLGFEEKELLSLSRRFAQTPVLRLFLEGVYGKGQVSDGILIGAANQRQLDTLTDLIHQRDPAKCMNYEETVCTEFPLGALSLSSSVWVNGHRTSCLFGSSLADFLASVPQPEQARVLKSAEVLRRVNPGHYAEIYFQRTKDGASELRLLPGDRIAWRH